MTEEVAYFPQWTLPDMRWFFRGFYPTWNDKTYYGLLDFFQLPQKQKIQSFSKGMQRQAGLIAAFSSNARLLLLDEAFDGLDMTSRAAVRSLLRFYTAHFGAAAVVTSHNLAELELFADDVGMLSDGKLKLNRNLAELQKSCFRVQTSVPLPEESFSWRTLPAQAGYAYLAEQPEAQIRAALENLPVSYTLTAATLEDYFAKGRSGEALDWEEIF